MKYMSDKTIEYIPLKGFENDYEIMNEYPFTIRRKLDGYEISECDDGKGYIRVHLNCEPFRKHQLIAQQFIPNDDPEHKTQVDHRNKHRDDNHIENLRWVTPSQNHENQTSNNGVVYEFVDELPLDVIPIILYKQWEFESYFMDSNGDVWYDNGAQFRKLYVGKKNTINIVDIYHKRHQISIDALRREFL